MKIRPIYLLFLLSSLFIFAAEAAPERAGGPTLAEPFLGGASEEVVRRYLNLLDPGVRRLQWAREQAEAGDATAQFELGLTYLRGGPVEVAPAEAVKWLGKAAENGQMEAALVLGTMYEEGVGVRRDLAEAIRYYDLAARAGLLEAFDRAAIVRTLLAEPDFAGARESFARSAAMGSAEGHFYLGMFAQGGIGGERDLEEAKRRYRLAHQLGHADGLFALWAMPATSAGLLPNDFEGIRKYFEERAAAGEAEGLFRLGWMYFDGIGVNRNTEEAEKRLRAAVSLDNREAGFFLGRILSEKNDDASRAEGRRLLEAAANAGHPEANFFLGWQAFRVDGDLDGALAFFKHPSLAEDPFVFHQRALVHLSRPEPSDEDRASAHRLLEASASEGFVAAMLELAQSFYLGRLGDVDHESAAHWMLRAAMAGNLEARVQWGLLLSRGEGVEKRPRDAVRMFRYAAERDHAGGMFHLATAYWIGFGVDRSEQDCLNWMRLAALKGSPEAQRVIEEISPRFSEDNLARAEQFVRQRMTSARPR